MKKTYEKPEVTKVDFKFEDVIAASGECSLHNRGIFDDDSEFCWD